MVMEGGCVRDFEECDCDCHRIEGVMHVVACCFRCPHCGRNIAGEWYLHKERCKEQSV